MKSYLELMREREAEVNGTHAQGRIFQFADGSAYVEHWSWVRQSHGDPHVYELPKWGLAQEVALARAVGRRLSSTELEALASLEPQHVRHLAHRPFACAQKFAPPEWSRAERAALITELQRLETVP